jgi:deazaflavin-dependent oxidoreductase (nitroreductase family)
MATTAEENSWNESIMADFRAHGGQITEGRLKGAAVLLMTSIGARSGLPRIAPVAYHRDGSSYVIVGSNSGRDDQPTWLENIRRNPVVTVEVDNEKFQARARITEGTERRRLLDARIAAIPQFGEYEKMTTRELPVIRLDRIE